MPNLSSTGTLAAAVAQLTAASYHCFDRVVLFGHLMGLTRAGGLRNIYRNALGIDEITPEVLVARTERYRKWVYSFAQNRRIPILASSPEVRNEDLVERYYRRFRGKEGVVCILRTMEFCLTYVSRKPRFPTKDPKHHWNDKRPIRERWQLSRDTVRLTIATGRVIYSHALTAEVVRFF